MSVVTDGMRGIIGAALSAIDGSLPVKVPGITFVLPNDQKYFELVLIQNSGFQTWGNEQLYTGFLRVILHWPIDGRGVYPPVEVLSGVADLLPKGSVIFQGVARLLITDNPRITEVIEGGAENLYPMTVAYEFFHVL